MDQKRLIGIAASLMARNEICVAVDWWTEQLFKVARHDAGDPSGRVEMFAMLAQSRLDRPTERQIARFRFVLTALTTCLCADSWNEDEPKWGSANRTLATDYGPDSTLRCALEYAGISGGNLLLPIKTTLWISPSSVKVRPGYSGKEVVLFPMAGEE